MASSPNIGLNVPAINTYGWGAAINGDLNLIDAIFGGTRTAPALHLSDHLIVDGSIVAGSFAGLDGAFFLQSSLFNQPNGVPQLNGSGKIPSSLLTGQTLVAVPYSATPTFNAALGSGFNITLTGSVTASTFINGSSGGVLIAVRVIQDATGGRPFVWPTNSNGAGDVSQAPNAKSQQLFMLNVDGSLDAIAPMMYS